MERKFLRETDTPYVSIAVVVFTNDTCGLQQCKLQDAAFMIRLSIHENIISEESSYFFFASHTPLAGCSD